jgi:hypothetical protein
MGNIGVANAGAFGLTTASLGGGYFLGYFSSALTTNFAGGSNMGLDSSKNIYVSATNTADSNLYVFKASNSGVFVAAKTLTSPSSPNASCAVDGANNVYLGAYTANATTGYIAKINSDLTTFSKSLNINLNPVSVMQIFLDSSGTYFYNIGWQYIAPTFRIFWGKFNTSDLGAVAGGTISGSTAQRAYGGCVDSSGNAYFAGQSLTGATAASGEGLVWKVTSAMNVKSWSRRVYLGTTTTNNSQMYKVAVDSSSNVYAVGSAYFSGPTQTRGIINKYNTSGTIQWGRQYFTGSTTASEYINVAVDPASQYVYCVGTYNGAGNCILTKLDTSGNAIYHRQFSGSGIAIVPTSVYVNDDAVYISGSMSVTGATGRKVFIFKVPLDGTKTGTYTIGSTSLTYASVTPTATTSIHDAASTVTVSDSSPGTNTASVSISDTSTTWTPTTI